MIEAIRAGEAAAPGGRTSLVIFEGGRPGSDVEAMLAAVRRGVVLDVIRRAQAAEGIDEVIVCTDDPVLGVEVEQRGAVVDLDPVRPPEAGPFHFGRRLAELIERRRLERVCYMGGGLGALITSQELTWIASELRRTGPVVITNNLYSADLVAFNPASALLGLELPPLDNHLAWTLSTQAGLRVAYPPRTLGLHFDIDTPADVLVMAVHPGLGPETRASLKRLDLNLRPVRGAMATIQNPHADLLLFGRIGAPLFSYIDDKTRCRLRVFSEERGMKALGRDERGEVLSMMGFLVDAVGPERFFEQVGSVCETAFIDSRVLFAHWGLRLSASDRFNSDLGRPERIADPTVRRFTEAALGCPAAVLLGGHSLVTGGIWALVDAAGQGVSLAEADGEPAGQPAELGIGH